MRAKALFLRCAIGLLAAVSLGAWKSAGDYAFQQMDNGLKAGGPQLPVNTQFQKESVIALALGGDRFLLLRPVTVPAADAGAKPPECFEGVALTFTAQHDFSVGARLGDVSFCRSDRDDAVRSFPALNRIVTLRHETRTRAGLAETWTRVEAFDATTGKRSDSFDTEGRVTGIVPLGDGRFIASNFKTLWLLPAGKDDLLSGRAQVSWHFDKHYPLLFLQGEHRLAVLDARTTQLIADFDPGAKSRLGWGDYELVEAPGGLALKHHKGAAISFLSWGPGAAPREIAAPGVSQLQANLIVRDSPQGAQVVMRREWVPPWSGLVDLLYLSNAELDELLAAPPELPALEDRLSDTARLELGYVRLNQLPFDIREVAFEWPSGKPLPPRCFEFPATDSGEISSRLRDPAVDLGGQPHATACPALWKTAFDRLAARKQVPLELTARPQGAADYCLGALLRQRSSELLRCLDIGALLQPPAPQKQADDDERDPLEGALAATGESLARAVASKALHYDSPAFAAVAKKLILESLGPRTAELRYELLSYTAGHEALPKAKLSHVSPGSFTAEWTFAAAPPFTLRARFAKAKTKAKSAHTLPWVVTDTTYVDAAGKETPGIGANQLTHGLWP